MNERLRQLMLEAGYAAPELALRAQKLAALITQEYSNLARVKYNPENSTDYENVIFLDVDGVLNCTRSIIAFGGQGNAGNSKHWHKYDDVALRLIRSVSQKVNAPIVFSSSWRIVTDIPKFAEYYQLNIIDRTESLGDIRGEEIKEWLSRHPHVKNYAIIDDSNDMLKEQLPHFVQTCGDEGFTFKNLEQICRIFNIEPYSINKPN